MSSDDRTMLNPEARFGGKLITITEKMDGENTTMTRNLVHARSVDSGYHESRTWVKNLWAQVRYEIPEGWSVVGENMYALHSIFYDKLPSYFLVFAIVNDGMVLSMANTVHWCNQHGLAHVPILGTGLYSEKLLREFQPEAKCGTLAEGYVIRPERAFMLDDWGEKVAKFVRTNHVQTSDHWMHQSVTQNQLV